MNILPEIMIIDLALLIDKTLIIADTHIGYEESLNKQGILVPRFQFKEIIQRLERIIGNKRFDKIIINGDIKHEFGTISEQEWRHTLRLMDFLKQYCGEIILIKGNHDTILGPIAKKRNIKVVDYYIINNEKNQYSKNPLKKIKDKKNILVVHGDKIDDKILNVINKNKIKTIIIGHEHPAVTLKEGPRAELYKAFLKGKWKKHNLIVQPSFNLVTEGTDVMKERLLSPFLKHDLRNFYAYIVADKVYGFGKLKNL